MALRAMSSATISFGLVSIPVKLYSSSDSGHAIRFNQIHEKDGSRLKQQMVCAADGQVVPKDEIVKGYEFTRDQYVLFTTEELKAIEAQNTKTIDIVEFVDATQVDRILLDKVYFLGPDKGGSRAYRLLSKALRETGRAGIAKYAARGKQYLVMLRPKEDGLVMEQLKYAEELRDFSEVPVEDVDVKKDELQLAIKLIDQAASEAFDPAQYKDEIRERIMEMIERKVEGEDITVAPTEEAESKIIDIMEALKASIADADRKPAKRAAKKKTATKKKAAKK